MNRASVLPILRALAAGPASAADVAAATGRTVGSVRVSLAAMAATDGRARDALVAELRAITTWRKSRRLYYLTKAGRAAIDDNDRRTTP